MAISPNLAEKNSNQLILSLEDSPARTYPAPAGGPALKEAAPDCGLNTSGWFVFYDHVLSLWRTCQVCLIEEWEEFSETWPQAGMTLNGTAFQLRPLAPRTCDTESSLWPTPNVPNGGRVIPQNALWSGKAAYKPDGKKVQVGLESAVRRWPTPTAVTNTGGLAMCKWGGAGSRAKLRAIVSPEEMNGALNPAWVEWLMGFPIGWTDLQPSETPSSLK